MVTKRDNRRRRQGEYRAICLGKVGRQSFAILIGDTEKGRNNPVFLSCDFLRMVPPKNAFLSLRLPIFGASYYIFLVEGRKEVLSSGSVLLCLHPLVLMPGELHGESPFSLCPNKFF